MIENDEIDGNFIIALGYIVLLTIPYCLAVFYKWFICYFGNC